MTFLGVPKQSGGKVQKAGRVCDGNYSSLTFQGPQPIGFRILVQVRKRKCHLFYLLRGIRQLNVTLRPGYDSSSQPLPCLLMSQRAQTHTPGTCPYRITDILNNADAWPCSGNLSHKGNLEWFSVAFWTNCADLWILLCSCVRTWSQVLVQMLQKVLGWPLFFMRMYLVLFRLDLMNNCNPLFHVCISR